MPSAHDAGSLRRGYVGIHTSGFKDFLLKPELMRAIQDCGFEHPSEGECAPSVVDAEPRSNPARREEFGPLEALGDPDGRKSAVAGPRTAMSDADAASSLVDSQPSSSPFRARVCRAPSSPSAAAV